MYCDNFNIKKSWRTSAIFVKFKVRHHLSKKVEKYCCRLTQNQLIELCSEKKRMIFSEYNLFDAIYLDNKMNHQTKFFL